MHWRRAQNQTVIPGACQLNPPYAQLLHVSYCDIRRILAAPTPFPFFTPGSNPLHIVRFLRTLGSGAPRPCPNGTSSSSFSLVSADECPPCQPGFYCPDVGTYNSTVQCTEGFYCPGKDAFPTLCVCISTNGFACLFVLRRISLPARQRKGRGPTKRRFGLVWFVVLPVCCAVRRNLQNK